MHTFLPCNLFGKTAHNRVPRSSCRVHPEDKPIKKPFQIQHFSHHRHNSPPASYGKLIFNSLTSPATLQHSKQQNGSMLWVTGSSLGCQSCHPAEDLAATLPWGDSFPAPEQEGSSFTQSKSDLRSAPTSQYLQHELLIRVSSSLGS